MKLTPKFPDHLRQNPLGQAVLRAYDEIAASPHSGLALFHTPDGPIPGAADFTVWIERRCRFAVNVYSGHYTAEDGRWLRQLDGANPTPVGDPVEQSWNAAMGIRQAICDAMNGKAFVIPVAVFADMQRDQSILDERGGLRVRILWGVDGLVDRLVELPEEEDVYSGLSKKRIKEEARALGDTFGGGEPVVPDQPMDLGAGQVIIQHVDTVNVYTVGAGAYEGQQPLMLPPNGR